MVKDNLIDNSNIHVNQLNSVGQNSNFNLITQFVIALSNAFPALGFVIAWVIYRSSDSFAKALIGFLLSSIISVCAVLIKIYFIRKDKFLNEQ
jgi:hypothetical protein